MGVYDWFCYVYDKFGNQDIIALIVVEQFA
jgi:hypothetical protein